MLTSRGVLKSGMVQDDKDDWIVESRRMCDIYAKATLTISADASWSISDGGFRDQSFAARQYRETADGRKLLYQKIYHAKLKEYEIDEPSLRPQGDGLSPWRSIIQTYTFRALTFDDDRLPALSGLASNFHDMSKDALGQADLFLSGLWKAD